MKPFDDFLRENVSPETLEYLSMYDEFPPTQPHSGEEEENIYKHLKFRDIKHYLKDQIETMKRLAGNQKDRVEELLMKPEVQRKFRLHYAKKFPELVDEI